MQISLSLSGNACLLRSLWIRINSNKTGGNPTHFNKLSVFTAKHFKIQMRILCPPVESLKRLPRRDFGEVGNSGLISRHYIIYKKKQRQKAEGIFTPATNLLCVDDFLVYNFYHTNPYHLWVIKSSWAYLSMSLRYVFSLPLVRRLVYVSFRY